MAGRTARWDAEAQRWHRGVEPAGYAPPPPPRPEYLPRSAQDTVGPPASEPTPGVSGREDGREQGRTLGRKPVVVLSVATVLGAVGVAAWLAPVGAEKTPPVPPGASGAPSSAPGSDRGSGGESTGPGGRDRPSPGGSRTPGTGGPVAGAEAPAGYRVVEDQEGFRIAVPEGWERTSGPNGVFYRAADERSLLQIFRITEPDLGPLEAVESASSTLSQRTEDYREVSLGPVSSGPENPAGDAAELHYAYDSQEAGGVRECIERAFTATDGDKYAVLACAPAEDAPYQRNVLDTALAYFAPGGL